jgi:hypothetical protein
VKEEKMKGTMLKKSVLLMSAVLFAISFATVPVSGEEIAETKTITGSISAIQADTGTVEVKDQAGETMSLKAGSDINLEAFSAGQNVTVECSDQGLIKNISPAAH